MHRAHVGSLVIVAATLFVVTAGGAPPASRPRTASLAPRAAAPAQPSACASDMVEIEGD